MEWQPRGIPFVLCIYLYMRDVQPYLWNKKSMEMIRITLTVSHSWSDLKWINPDCSWRPLALCQNKCTSSPEVGYFLILQLCWSSSLRASSLPVSLHKHVLCYPACGWLLLYSRAATGSLAAPRSHRLWVSQCHWVGTSGFLQQQQWLPGVDRMNVPLRETPV